MSVAGTAGEELLLSWPEWALEAGQMGTALQAAASTCEALPACIPAWQQRLALQAHQAAVQASCTSESVAKRDQPFVAHRQAFAAQSLKLYLQLCERNLSCSVYHNPGAL